MSLACEPVTWIASRRQRRRQGGCNPWPARHRSDLDSNLKLLDLPAAAYHAFYETFCNPILWFTQHSLGELLRGRNVARQAVDAWHAGYLPVNQAFADAVIDEIPFDGAGTRVMLHDYHLYLAPRLIRAARPRASLQHFVHIPWPGPAAWRRYRSPSLEASAPASSPTTASSSRPTRGS